MDTFLKALQELSPSELLSKVALAKNPNIDVYDIPKDVFDRTQKTLEEFIKAVEGIQP